MLRSLIVLTLIGLAGALALSVLFALLFPLALVLLKLAVVVAVLAGLGYLLLRLLDPVRADRYAQTFKEKFRGSPEHSSRPEADPEREVPIQ